MWLHKNFLEVPEVLVYLVFLHRDLPALATIIIFPIPFRLHLLLLKFIVDFFMGLYRCDILLVVESTRDIQS